ncbi:6-phosphogluconolactonase [Martelella mediterranea]|uniref:Glucosamine-6-phosphate deaminase n=1 Tax=Martelella mediterranea TaxID=293089 RepID=A0A2T0J4I4_9HYPH|nr:6-phosphogluconolactonase [Martelella mediterranea]TCT30838.1 glucosamine-6-phosphate deaminase [Martelella mediterranea]
MQTGLTMTECRILPTPEAIGRHVAETILDGFDAARAAGKTYLLGCPTGRTPRPVYAALADMLWQAPRDLSGLVLVMMDEYVLADTASALRLAAPEAHYSCQGFAEREIRQFLNAVLPPEDHLPTENVWFADIDEPEAYDRRIAEAGGLDFFILASGASDGHVAFNPPGTPRHSLTRVLTLAEETRIDNMSTFPGFADISEVPTHGISVGLETIAGARDAAMILTGAGKQLAFQRMTGTRGFDPDWPASIVHDCAKSMILADLAAAGH